MSDRLFVRLCVYLALIFVPVVFVYGPVRLVTPCSYVLYAFLFERAHQYQSYWAMIRELLPVVSYGLAFYAGARLAFALSQRMPLRRARIAFQVAVLAVIFACSFLRVIGRETSWTHGETYTFWSACGRYQEKYLPQDRFN